MPNVAGPLTWLELTSFALKTTTWLISAALKQSISDLLGTASHDDFSYHHIDQARDEVSGFFIIIAFYEYKVDLSGARLHLTLVDPEASYTEID